MSLKAFHIVFILMSSALAFGCGAWRLRNYFSTEGRGWDIVFAISSFIAGIALIIYGRYFLKKLRNVSYL